jgi:FkbM family methyltransferase
VVDVTIEDGLGSYTLQAFPGDVVTRGLEAKHRPYERRALRTIEALLGPGDVVVDVGANIGNHAIYLARRGVTVHALEPSPIVFPVLEHNVERLGCGRIQLHRVALGSAAGTATIDDRTDGRHANTVVDTSRPGNVPVETLDGFVEVHGISRVALLKVDVETFELDVLGGALETIRRDWPIIMIEAIRPNLDAVSRMLVGYRRLPLMLADQTYLFAPSVRPLLRAASTLQPMLWTLAWLRWSLRNGGRRRAD